MSYYQTADQSLWTGRSVSPDLPPQYWYQSVEFVDLDESVELEGALVILGYAVDEGVRRNQGRVGAAGGPDAARPHLGRLGNHLGDRRLLDAGNVVCPDGNLEAAQEELSRRVAQLLEAGAKPVVIGGGHDIAYGHFRGIHRAHGGAGATFGVINFDAHLDLRNPAGGATSGTPFHQIMEEFGDDTYYLAVGIQPAANPPSLLETADRFAVQVISELECYRFPQEVLKSITLFAEGVDHLYVTVDLDTFPAGAAPGVSALNPGGLAPAFVLAALEQLGFMERITSADVAEYNPQFDGDGLAGRLVSRVVFELVA